LREPVRANAASGHDTATLQAFSGGLGGHRALLPIDLPPVSLRLSAKRGIVTRLDAARRARIEIDCRCRRKFLKAKANPDVFHSF
jgi:hypothetical protein